MPGTIESTGMKLRPPLVSLVLIFTAHLCAQPQGEGAVSGAVVDKASNHPIEFASIVLKKTADNSAVQNTVTDSRGRFTLENVPAGDYKIVYSFVGWDSKETKPFTVDAQHKALDLGRLDIAEGAVKMEKLEVKTRQTEFYNTIDRKVYNVGKEIQSATGSASDLLQNIPSVQVDIEGNVSLRSSENVMILIDGRTSPLMGKNRAAVLQQLPADAIEKIEVITNPSAKYKPDGTAGIINIVMKRKRESGFSSTVSASAGNDRRYNASIFTNYNPGKYNLFGSYSLRRDDRTRHASDTRTLLDAAANRTSTAETKTGEHSRPLSHIAQAGIDYNVDEHNKLGVAGSYNYRDMLRRGVAGILVKDGRGAVTSDYDRIRTNYETEEDLELSASYQHRFPKEDHEMKLEFKSDSTPETEDNRYANVYRTPVSATTYDNTLTRLKERRTEAIAEYVYPINDDSRLEAGYTREAKRADTNLLSEDYNATTGSWVKDVAKSNHFIYDETIHALYATYGRTLGKFGFLAGLRQEQAYLRFHLVETGETVTNDYFRLYPSLHLAYQLTDKHELQMNYSHRVERPDGEDLNPVPEFKDPINLRVGNPHLLPEDIHSVELGYHFKTEETTFIATVYHRYLYHGITEITRDIGNSILLTTKENLATNRSTGVELAATKDIGGRVTLNFSSNTFFNTIDASNLGYSSRKSIVSWSAKLGASIHLAKNTLVQCNTNYSSAKTTPQGEKRPSFVANIGLRQDFLQKKAAVVLTVSDIFDSWRETSLLSTPTLHQEVVRRRSPRIIYVGFIYNFGKQTNKSKDDSIKFEN